MALRRILTFLLGLLILAGFGLIGERAFAQGALPTLGSDSGPKYQVLVQSNLDKETATKLQQTLVNDGFTPVDLVDTGGGKYNVLIGRYPSEKEAEGLLEALKLASYLPEKIQSTNERASNQRTVSTAEKGKVYRVKVFESENEQMAKEAAQRLKEDDYSGVEVLQKDGKHIVVLNSFSNESEAKTQQDSLHRDGYPAAEVVAFAQDGPLPTAPVMTPPPQVIAAGGMTPEQKQQVQKALDIQQRILQGTATSNDTEERKALLKGFTAEQRGEYHRQEDVLAAAFAKARQIQAIYRDFRKALAAQQLDEAKKLLTDAQQVSKDDQFTAKMSNEFADAERTKKTGNQAQIAELMEKGQTALLLRDYAAARTYFSEVKKLDPANLAASVELDKLNATGAGEKSPRTAATEGAGAPATPTSTLANLPMWTWVAIGVLVLVLLVVLAVFLQNSRRERELIQHMQKMTSTPTSPESTAAALFPGQDVTPPVTGASPLSAGSLSLGQDVDMGMSAVVSTAGAAGAAGQEKPKPASKKAGKGKADSESDMVMISDLFDMNKMPKAPRPGGEADAHGDETPLNLPGLDLPGLESPHPAASGAPGLNLPDFNIDELLKKPFPGAGSDAEEEDDALTQPMARIEDIPIQQPGTKRVPDPVVAPPSTPAAAPAAPAAEPIPSGREAALAETIPLEMPAVTAAPSAVPAPQPAPVPEAAPAAAPAAAAAFFQQDFELETVGDQPAGWRGEYDYATLTVDDTCAAPGSARSLRFEKRSGAGSANYVCNFPKASGMVTVEFDIRCDDKNKYLLGFYVEKDEDFKQSVHTIVHRVDSKSQPSLRIQGEPIPYEFGTWKHVRYEVNLLAGIVNAFVDEQQVVTEAKLATVPAYLNTLSIRDNLATTGLLFLDNIRITRG